MDLFRENFVSYMSKRGFKARKQALCLQELQDFLHVAGDHTTTRLQPLSAEHVTQYILFICSQGINTAGGLNKIGRLKYICSCIAQTNQTPSLVPLVEQVTASIAPFPLFCTQSVMDLLLGAYTSEQATYRELREQLLLHLAYFYKLSVSTLIGLTWSMFKPDRFTVPIGAKSRSIELRTQDKQLIEQYYKATLTSPSWVAVSPYLFPVKRGLRTVPLTSSAVWSIFKALLKKATLTPTTPASMTVEHHAISTHVHELYRQKHPRA